MTPLTPLTASLRRERPRSKSTWRWQLACAALAVSLALAGTGCHRGDPSARAAVRKSAGSPAASASPIRFEDITQRAGLDFIQRNGGCGQRYFIEQVAAGAAVFDANGDGNLDIYFPAPKPLGVCTKVIKQKLTQRLYLGDGKGHFTLSPNAFGGGETDYGIAAAVGDYDNDGHPDLYVACYGKNKLYHNRGDGTFEDVTARAGVEVGGFSTGAVWFDYDGDGKLDLYVMRYTEWSLETNLPCPGDLPSHAGCDPLTYPAAKHVLFHNNGNGTFTDVTAKALPQLEPSRGLGAAAADFDGDGKLDLFVANDLGPNFLWRNKGDGTFEDVAMQRGCALGANGDPQANMGIAVGDYNQTARLSVAITTLVDEPYTLYRNDGRVYFDATDEAGIGKPTLPFLGFGTGFVDCSNTGVLDLFFANGHVLSFPGMRKVGAGYKQRNQLFVNDGQGQFTEAVDALPKDDVRVHRGACFGDFDNDGRMDILVTASDDRPTLLHNETPGGHWLLLDLTNRYGCCTPIGTKCTAYAGGRKLYRVVLGGGSYGGESDHRVHFGLGQSIKIDKLEIEWLSGAKQVIENVKADQILKVKEK